MPSDTAEVMVSALAIGKQIAARGMSLERSSQEVVKIWGAVKLLCFLAHVTGQTDD